MIKSLIYEFSFTASSLRLNDMILVAKASLDNQDFDYVNILGNGKATTGKRLFSEINKRLSNLTTKQLLLLADSDYTNQKQIAFLSICKTYGFIRDFVVGVLREKYLLYDYKISEGDYISFYRRTNELHPEMDEFTEQTIKKLRQVTFKILEESGLIDSVRSKEIHPPIIDDKVIDAIIQDNPEWLKVFLLSDLDINSLIN
jgi:hypothetical protein